MTYFPPSERWVRLRHWLGYNRDQITESCIRLSLPGYSFEPGLVIAAILERAPAPPSAPHLRVVDRDRRAKRKPDPLAWVLSQPEQISPEDYAAQWRLDYYLQSPAGRESVRSAVRIWQTPVLRAIACAGLVTSQTHADVARYLRRYAPKSQHPFLRKTDVAVFEEIFWDFRTMSLPERADFMAKHPSTFDYHVAAHCGFDVYLRQIGLLKADLDRKFFQTEVKEIAAGWLKGARRNMSDVSPFALASMWNTVNSVLGEEQAGRERGGMGEGTAARIEAAYIRVSKPQPLPQLNDMLLDVETTQLRDDVDTALDMGAITEEEAQGYYIRIDLGEPIGTEVRDRIAATKSRMDGSEDPLANASVNTVKQRRQA